MKGKEKLFYCRKIIWTASIFVAKQDGDNDLLVSFSWSWMLFFLVMLILFLLMLILMLMLLMLLIFMMMLDSLLISLLPVIECLITGAMLLQYLLCSLAWFLFLHRGDFKMLIYRHRCCWMFLRIIKNWKYIWLRVRDYLLWPDYPPSTPIQWPQAPHKYKQKWQQWFKQKIENIEN